MVAESQVLIAVGGAPAQMRMGLAVSANYFDVLRVARALGRTFREDEKRYAVVVLAHAFWKAQFGANPKVTREHDATRRHAVYHHWRGACGIRARSIHARGFLHPDGRL